MRHALFLIAAVVVIIICIMVGTPMVCVGGAVQKDDESELAYRSEKDNITAL
jgi:hypothetical protein